MFFINNAVIILYILGNVKRGCNLAAIGFLYELLYLHCLFSSQFMNYLVIWCVAVFFYINNIFLTLLICYSIIVLSVIISNNTESSFTTFFLFQTNHTMISSCYHSGCCMSKCKTPFVTSEIEGMKKRYIFYWHYRLLNA